MKPKVAFIGTGGTIASLGASALDIVDYGATHVALHADEIVARVPDVHEVADVIPISFRNVPSTHVFFDDWKELVLRCDALVATVPDLAGIVIGHGTASLEETAYFLDLTLKVPVPVVLVGSQRPLNGLSSDAALNLVNAICVAASPLSRRRGVLVCLNDEIQDAREVTKTSTSRMQTFRTPDFGILGQVDGQVVSYYRRSERRQAPETEFDIRGLDALPRVDIVYSYTGSDGAAVGCFVDKGATGIVSAGFAPSMGTPAEITELKAAVAKGVIVVQATRAGSGRTAPLSQAAEAGFVVSDNLTPQKSRLLLALALSVTRDPTEIARIFATY